MAKYAKNSKGLLTSLITNGTLIKSLEIAYNIKENFDHITVSLDGSSPATNDIHRGKGSFVKILQGINYLSTAGVKFDINSTISYQNVEGVTSLKQFVNNYHAKHNITTSAQLGRGKNSEIITNNWELYIKIHNRLTKTSSGDEADFILHKINKEGFKPKFNCGLGSGEIYIDSTGNIFPCKLVTGINHLIGNIKEKPLKDLLKTEKFDNIRNLDISEKIVECRDCYLRWLCGGGCRGYHLSGTGKLYQNDDEFCKILRHRIISLMWVIEKCPMALADDTSYEPNFIKLN